jgi:hypothetical protein
MTRKPFTNDKSLIELFGKTISESKMAVQIDFGDRVLWVPISQMEDWPEVGFNGSVLIKEWIAKKEGLI